MKISIKEYDEIKALRASDLSALDKSPAHYQHHIATRPDSASMAFGRGTHAAVLEPAAFSTQYAIAPKVDKRTKEGKAAWAEFEANNAGREILSQEDGDRIGGIIQAIHGHGTATKILQALSAVEESFTWDDGGIPCKSRLDGYSIKLGAVVDLKTTRDASLSAFSRAIVSYGYHRQAAFYLRAAKPAALHLDSFVFICVESEPPHAVAVYALDAAAIAQGDAEVSRLLEVYRKCIETGVWPGYADEIKTIQIPKWAYRDVPFEGEPRF